MTAKRARKALQGPGVVVMYSSGERVVDWCTRGMVPGPVSGPILGPVIDLVPGPIYY